MVPPKIEEGNKIIAEFDGWIWGNVRGWISGEREVFYRKEGHQITKALSVDKLKYHSSWDWQIPAWRKANLAVKDAISKLINEKPGLMHINERHFLKQICEDYNNAVFQNDPAKGQQVIVEAIQWYNSQNK